MYRENKKINVEMKFKKKKYSYLAQFWRVL